MNTHTHTHAHTHTHTHTHGQHCWAGWLSCSVTQGKMLIRFFVHTFIETEHHISQSAVLPLSSHVLCLLVNCELYLLLTSSMAKSVAGSQEKQKTKTTKVSTRIILFRPRVHSPLCRPSAAA